MVFTTEITEVTEEDSKNFEVVLRVLCVLGGDCFAGPPFGSISAVRYAWWMTLYRTDDLRIKWTRVVLPPVFLEEELPVTEKAAATVHDARSAICDILAGRDPRLLVVVGPCSIHDTKAAREYAGLLKKAVLSLRASCCW